MATKTEFVVDMTCNSCVETVKKALSGFSAIEHLDISLETRQVIVTGKTPTSDIVRAIRAAGLRVAIAGKSSAEAHLGSGVAQFVGPDIKGVIFFTQLSEEDCLIDVTLDGLEPNKEHKLALHQWGDLSGNYSKVGGFYTVEGKETGYLGELVTTTGTGQLNKVHPLNVEMVYGRAACVHKDNKIIGAAMVVRSSGVFQNTKRICTCDGTSIWEAQSSI